MFSIRSACAITVRHLLLLKQDYNLLLAAFYWPFLDILIWGFLGAWIGKIQTDSLHNYNIVALLGILLWQVVGRGCNVINNAFNEELFAHNIVNLFSLPIRISEWMVGVILFCLIMISITTGMSLITIYCLYDLQFWFLIKTFFLFAPSLFLSCLWLGFTGLQILVNFGRRGVELTWVCGWFLAPFSGAFYPIEVLPTWAQTVSSYIPMSSIFMAMRNYVMHEQDPTEGLLKGTLMGVLYAGIALLLFVYLFNRSKTEGLARLTD